MATFKKFRKLLIVPLMVAMFAFWVVTAPASLAMQRIAAGSGNGSGPGLISGFAERYSAPMNRLCRMPLIKRINDSLVDKWCDLLAAPETTP